MAASFYRGHCRKTEGCDLFDGHDGDCHVVLKDTVACKVLNFGSAPVAEKSGGPTSYYLCDVVRPNQGKVPYQAECGDIIEALGMNFNEGCAFKAIWRTAAARTLGKLKEGGDARYDAQKVQFYGGRMLAQFEPPLGDSGMLGGVVIGPQPTLSDAKDIMQYMVDNAPGFREFLETLQKPV